MGAGGGGVAVGAERVRLRDGARAVARTGHRSRSSLRPGAKPPQRYDPWQLATLDRGHIPERLWGHIAIPLARGATLDLIAPEAPSGIPLKLPAKAPKPTGGARTSSVPADPETGAADGGY